MTSCPLEKNSLNVRTKYDNGNDSWLRSDVKLGGWAVAFHGVRGLQTFVVQGVKENGFLPGPNQIRKDDKIASGELVGEGIYCTPDIKVAEDYAKDAENKIMIDGKE